MSQLNAPFPYFGGKSAVAAKVWRRLGRVRSYVEPFFGSGAVLLGRPTPFDGSEVVNDVDGLVANFWRAIKSDPDAVAEYADYPVIECDLHARHAWLVGVKDSLAPRLEGDPEWYDAKVAGWWAWGLSCWIGSGFCSGDGPWRVVESDGVRRLVRSEPSSPDVGPGTDHLEDSGRGVHRKLIHLGDLGRGVHRQLIHLGGNGQGVHRLGRDRREGLFDYFRALADRLRRVRVCCGDWSRVVGDSPLLLRSPQYHPIGVFLDPPYSAAAGRESRLYRVDSEAVAHAVREWAIERGDDSRFRICLAGYDGEHVMPDSWIEVEGKSGRGHGYGGQNRDGYANAERERLWFSPHCRRVGLVQGQLFPKGEQSGPDRGRD